DPQSKLVVYACYIISGVCAIGLGIPPYEAIKQVVFFAILTAAILAAVLTAGRYYRSVTTPQRVTSIATTPLPMLPGWPRLTDLQLSSLAKFLEEIREKAYDFIKREKSSLVDDHVRSNIFFPYHGESGKKRDF